MSARKGRQERETRGDSPSLASRLGSHFTISAAIVLTDFGVSMMFNPRAETGWADVGWMAVHALAVGVVVLLWLPLSAWLARQARLPGAAAEGVMVVVLGLAVAGIEFGVLHHPDRVSHTVVAVVGMLAGWAMRIPPPPPRQPSPKR
jgi:hypothetical protein